MQKQKGVSDCGPFAIAFAYHAALGDDLRTITFDQDKLRTHLVTCFEKEMFSRFPLDHVIQGEKSLQTITGVGCVTDCQVL